MREPTCYDCRNGEEKLFGGGWGVGVTSQFICYKEEQGDKDVIDFMKKYKDKNVLTKKGPYECPSFDPWKVKECSWVGCKKEIDITLYEAEFFVSNRSKGTHFFCSNDCKSAYLVLREMEDK